MGELAVRTLRGNMPLHQRQRWRLAWGRDVAFPGLGGRLPVGGVLGRDHRERRQHQQGRREGAAEEDGVGHGDKMPHPGLLYDERYAGGWIGDGLAA